MTGLDGLLNDVTIELWYVFAVFLRIGPAMASAPGFGHNLVPVRSRLLTGLMLSAALAPVVQESLPATPPEFDKLARFILFETMIGLFFGLIARSVLHLLEMAGMMISQSVSLSQMLGNTVEPMPVISHILTVSALAIIFSTSLANEILVSFVLTYELEIPSVSDALAFAAMTWTKLINYIFVQAFVLASGFISIFLIYYLAIGFSNKALPQLMVSFIGIPFVSLYSIYLLLKHSEPILSVWQQKALQILEMPMSAFK
ncbi:flagellar biosynthetic protein FliR [Marivita hallyeonensis]|uniref:Flagellar biosynthetic protein FliR n=1 Tax=Marivita hallyeonensis TaxID=996342 RepID=A0A1M5UN50_9RHOB|nr:flagellar biosynthetic protein FliR [Marivita hallyeonensis]SHH64298.1 flagellar biosynthetic protein FliR [Marivita hallyeonensis]